MTEEKKYIEDEVQYLGDGVYATRRGGELLLTANHHDPEVATDKIYFDRHTEAALRRLLLGVE